MNGVKNKTLATALALLLGVLGLHRFYLYGFKDKLGWVLPFLAGLGVYGIWRAKHYGLDDGLSWMLIPLGGFVFASCCLTAIVYGLMDTEKWNARFGQDAEAAAGATNWFTVLMVCISLLVGAAVLMASLTLSFQRYFEYEVEQARKISQ